MPKRKGMSREFLRKLRQTHHLGEFSHKKTRSHARHRFIRHRPQIKYMARRHRSSRFRSYSGKALGILRNPMLRQAAAGIGMATIAVNVIDRFVPQASSYRQMAELGAAYLGGGVIGLVANYLLKSGFAIGGTTSTSTGEIVT